MNRSVKLSMLIALALGSTQALALGLGQIRVKSALDKPLVAEVPLQTDYPGEADQVQVQLASAADFARAGLDRSQLSVPLKFEVVAGADGGKVIRITSERPVHETYLDFLIKVSWPKGQLLREYTVLLDPPGMVRSAAPQTAAPAAAPAPSTRPASTRHAAPAASGSGAGRVHGDTYGPVQAGDTLSEIAEQVRHDGVSLNQTLLALKEANPDAFFKDNVNALKRGAVLRIPSRQQAQARSAADALAEVRRENEDWSGATATAPTRVVGAGAGAASGAGAGARTAAGDHLQLVPPKQGSESPGARAGVAGGTGNVSVQQLRQDLARARESLSSMKQESGDLQTRLKSLEQINDKNQRLLDLKNAEIAELQDKLAQARKSAGLPPAKPAAAASAGKGEIWGKAAGAAPAAAGSARAPQVAAASTAAGSAARASTAMAAPAPVKPVQKPAAKPVQKPASKPVAPSRPQPLEQPWYAALWVKVAGGVAVLALLLLLALRGRKPRAKAVAGPSLADQFGDSPFGGSDADAMDAEQAELLEQLAESPDDIGLHLELVSLYYSRQDVEHFEAAAEAMYAHVTDPEQPEWQDVVAMGEELAPGHPLFAESAASAFQSEAYEPPHEDDADAHASEAHEDEPDTGHAPSSEAAAERADGSEYSFDFDLTPRRPAPASEAPTEDEFDSLPPLEEFEGGDEGTQGAAGATAHAGDEAGSLDYEVPRELESLDEEAPAAEPQFGDDPVDTKLDLARAYLDMGDPDGARAMLEEVLSEGSQAQRDTAQKLLDEIG